LFRGEESALLDKFAEISRAVPIAQFEVRGADLEQIFLAFVEKQK
jgi:hypothetical protein